MAPWQSLRSELAPAVERQSSLECFLERNGVFVHLLLLSVFIWRYSLLLSRLIVLLSHVILNDDDVGLHVLGCRFDMLGTNCRMILNE